MAKWRRHYGFWGTLQMKSDIEAILEEALLEEGLETLEQFKERGQFLTVYYG